MTTLDPVIQLQRAIEGHTSSAPREDGISLSDSASRYFLDSVKDHPIFDRFHRQRAAVGQPLPDDRPMLAKQLDEQGLFNPFRIASRAASDPGQYQELMLELDRARMYYQMRSVGADDPDRGFFEETGVRAIHGLLDIGEQMAGIRMALFSSLPEWVRGEGPDTRAIAAMSMSDLTTIERLRSKFPLSRSDSPVLNYVYEVERAAVGSIPTALSSVIPGGGVVAKGASSAAKVAARSVTQRVAARLAAAAGLRNSRASLFAAVGAAQAAGSRTVQISDHYRAEVAAGRMTPREAAGNIFMETAMAGAVTYATARVEGRFLFDKVPGGKTALAAGARNWASRMAAGGTAEFSQEIAESVLTDSFIHLYRTGDLEALAQTYLFNTDYWKDRLYEGTVGFAVGVGFGASAEAGNAIGRRSAELGEAVRMAETLTSIEAAAADEALLPVVEMMISQPQNVIDRTVAHLTKAAQADPDSPKSKRLTIITDLLKQRSADVGKIARVEDETLRGLSDLQEADATITIDGLTITKDAARAELARREFAQSTLAELQRRQNVGLQIVEDPASFPDPEQDFDLSEFVAEDEDRPRRERRESQYRRRTQRERDALHMAAETIAGVADPYALRDQVVNDIIAFTGLGRKRAERAFRRAVRRYRGQGQPIIIGQSVYEPDSTLRSNFQSAVTFSTRVAGGQLDSEIEEQLREISGAAGHIGVAPEIESLREQFTPVVERTDIPEAHRSTVDRFRYRGPAGERLQIPGTEVVLNPSESFRGGYGLDPFAAQFGTLTYGDAVTLARMLREVDPDGNFETRVKQNRDGSYTVVRKRLRGDAQVDDVLPEEQQPRLAGKDRAEPFTPVYRQTRDEYLADVVVDPGDFALVHIPEVQGIITQQVGTEISNRRRTINGAETDVRIIAYIQNGQVVGTATLARKANSNNPFLVHSIAVDLTATDGEQQKAKDRLYKAIVSGERHSLSAYTTMASPAARYWLHEFQVRYAVEHGVYATAIQSGEMSAGRVREILAAYPRLLEAAPQELKTLLDQKPPDDGDAGGGGAPEATPAPPTAPLPAGSVDAAPEGVSEADWRKAKERFAKFRQTAVYGNEADLILQSGRVMRVRYGMADIASMTPTHSGPKGNWQKEPGALYNERLYHDPIEGRYAREKVRERAEDFQPSYWTTDTPDGINGPPVTLWQDGQIIGGTGRTLTAMLIYDGESAGAMRDAMLAATLKFGIDRAAAQKFRKPYLFREIIGVQPGEVDVKALSRELNEAPTTAKSLVVDAVSRANLMSERTAEIIEKFVNPIDTEQSPTIAEILADEGKVNAIVTAFTADRIFNDNDLARYRDADLQFNASGKDAIRQVMVATLVNDAAVLGSMRGKVENNVMGSLSELLRVARHPEHGPIFRHVLFEAIRAHRAWKASGIADLTAFLFEQTSMLPAPGWQDARVAALVAALDGYGSRGFRDTVRTFVQTLGMNPLGTADMFGGQVKVIDDVNEAIVETFTVGTGAKANPQLTDAQKRMYGPPRRPPDGGTIEVPRGTSQPTKETRDAATIRETQEEARGEEGRGDLRREGQDEGGAEPPREGPEAPEIQGEVAPPPPPPDIPPKSGLIDKLAENLSEAKRKRLEELRKRLSEGGGDVRMGSLLGGLDPQKAAAMVEMSALIIEAGARTFAKFARAAVEQFGQWVKPHARDLYLEAIDSPTMDQQGLDSPRYVESLDDADVDRILATKEPDDAGQLAGFEEGRAGSGDRRAGESGRLADDAAGPGRAGLGSVRETGAGRRPGLQIVDRGDIPEPTRLIADDEYGPAALDENQFFGTNLALTHFLERKGHGFLLGDGAGVGKTRQEIAIAHQMQKRLGGRVAIVTTSDHVIDGQFKPSILAMGFDPAQWSFADDKNFDPNAPMTIGTFDDMKSGSGFGRGEYTLIVFDESQKLKNTTSATHMAARRINAKHIVFASATPMDKPLGAAYFMSQITGIDEEQVHRMLGFHIQEMVNEKGELVRTPVANEGMTWPVIYMNLLEMRSQAIRQGAMIRREFPFFGEMHVQQAYFTPEESATQRVIVEWWNGAIASAEPKERRSMYGQRALELNKWNEITKVRHAVEAMRSALERGRSVIIVGEHHDALTIKGLDGHQTIGVLGQIGRYLDEQGIEFARIFGKSDKASEIKRFQDGKIRVALMTPQSGGTGVDLDDQTGANPRTMIVLTLNFAGDVLDQMLGRVSRRNTVTPAEVNFIVNNASIADQHKKKVVTPKMQAMRAIQRGEDIDVAHGFENPLDETADPDEREIAEILEGKSPAQRRKSRNKRKPTDDFPNSGDTYLSISAVPLALAAVDPSLTTLGLTAAALSLANPRVRREVNAVFQAGLDVAVRDLPERVRSQGGSLAEAAANMGRAAIDGEKEAFGALSAPLDEVLRLTTGLGASAKAIVELQHGEIIEGEVDGREVKVEIALMQEAVEGRAVPRRPHSRKIVEAIRKLIDAYGRLSAERGHLQFDHEKNRWSVFNYIPGGKVYPRVLTQETFGILMHGDERRIAALVDALWLVNKDTMSRDSILHIVRSMRKDFQQADDDAAIHRINAEFTRQIPRMPTTIWIDGDPVPIIHTMPREFATRYAHVASARAGFIKVFGQSIDGWYIRRQSDDRAVEFFEREEDARAWAATEQDQHPGGLKIERHTDKVGMIRKGLASQGKNADAFVQMTRALNGMPVEAPRFDAGSLGWRIKRGISVLGSFYKTGMLSARTIANLPEPLGNMLTFGDPRDWAVATARLVKDYHGVIERLRNLGAITHDVVSLGMNVHRKGHSIANIARQVGDRILGAKFVEEAHEQLGAAIAEAMTERFQRGQGTDLDAVNVQASMKWPMDRAIRVSDGKGTQEEYLAIIRRYPAFLTGGAMRAAEQARINHNQAYRATIWFQMYAHMKVRSLANLAESYGSIREFARKNPDRKAEANRLMRAWTFQMGRYIAGTPLAGVLRPFVWAFATGLWYGFGEQWEEAKDEPVEFLLEGFAYSMFAGPFQFIYKSGLDDPDKKLAEALWGLSPPLGVLSETVDLALGRGRYETRTGWEALGEYGKRFVPASRFAGSAMAVFSASARKNLKHEVARRAYWRFVFEEGLPRTQMQGEIDEQDREFRRHMAAAAQRFQRDDWSWDDIWKALEVDGKDMESVRRSILARRFLHGRPGFGDDEEGETNRQRLLDRIGPDAFETLESHDQSMQWWASSFAPPRKKTRR